jgi:hypothetical protein
MEQPMSNETQLAKRSDADHFKTLLALSNKVDGRMFGCKDEMETFTLMMLADAEGLHPLHGLARFHIIKGRPSKKADAILADFQAAGGVVKWGEQSDACVEGTFTHPAGGSITVRWDNERVKKAGLTGGNHNSFPQQMKRARCISEGVRAVFPRAAGIGIYTPEETQSFEGIEEPVQRPTVEPVDEDTSKAIVKAFAQRIHEATSAHQLTAIGAEIGQANISEDDRRWLRGLWTAKREELLNKVRPAEPEPLPIETSVPMNWDDFTEAMTSAASANDVPPTVFDAMMKKLKLEIGGKGAKFDQLRAERFDAFADQAVDLESGRILIPEVVVP